MSAHKASFISNGKEFMTGIAEYFVPAQHLHEIDDVDEMLGQHGQEGGQVHHHVGQAYPGNAISSADADHDAVEGRLIDFHGSTIDSRCQIVGNSRCTMFTIFYHLRYGCFFPLRNIEHIVAGDINILPVNGSQELVRLNPTTAYRRQFFCCIIGDIRAFDTSCPDYGARFFALYFFIYLQINVLFSDFNNTGSKHCLYALFY